MSPISARQGSIFYPAARSARGLVAVILLSVQLFTFCLIQPASADSESEYAGLEFFGSSLMTRTELEKLLHLKVGSRASSVEKAVGRLKTKLKERRLFFNVETVYELGGKVFVSVDLINPSDDSVPYRPLKNPHPVRVSSVKPEELLTRLRARLEQLDSEGRQWSETCPSGVRMFSDEPANLIVKEIRRFGPVLRADWLTVVESDPDPRKREDAVELLNWAGSTSDTSARLIPALDDSDYHVRAAAARFLYARLSILPGQFPYVPLLAATCRLIGRPSNQDRTTGLYLMSALLAKLPSLTAQAAGSSAKKVAEISSRSIIPTVRQAARTLADQYDNPPPPPRDSGAEAPTAGF